MRRAQSLIFLLMLSWAGTLHASEGKMPVSKPAVSGEIIAVVSAQLAAFRAQDLPRAYGYAAAGLRLQTPLPAFARMVQRNYPEIWANTHAEFGVVRDDGSRAKLVVQVYAQEGNTAYDYVLFKEETGWRIGGVLRRAPTKGDRV